MSEILTPDILQAAERRAAELEALPDPNGNTSQSQNDEPVEFTPKQQAKLTEILKKAMGRSGAAHRQRADAAEKRVALLEAQLAGQSDGASDAEMWRAKAASEALRADAAIRREQEASKQAAQARLAASINSVDPDSTNRLLADQLRHDERGVLRVVQPDGTPRLGPDGVTPMTPEALYQDFAQSHPWLVKSSVISGVGSTESQRSALPRIEISVEQIFGPRSNAKLANRLAMQNPAEYQRMKKIAAQKGLI